MKYFLEHEPNSLEFLDKSWPELDRFYTNKEPQNSFLWALAQARHHRHSGAAGGRIRTPQRHGVCAAPGSRDDLSYKTQNV